MWLEFASRNVKIGAAHTACTHFQAQATRSEGFWRNLLDD
jgi:hypothetical protein